MRSATRSVRRGFSLLELSIVITIMSIVSVVGLESGAIFMNRTAYKVTQERLQAIDEALVKFRFANGYLPCPGLDSGILSSTSYGQSYYTAGSPGTGTCGVSVLTGSIRYGDVPVRDLNLPLYYMLDGYGNKLRYVVSGGMTTTAGFAAAANLIAIRTGRLETTCSASCTDIGGSTAADAAYLVLSFGADARGSGTGSTLCFPTPTANYDGMIDSANCQTSSGTLSPAVAVGIFYDSRYNPGSVELSHFDDILIWRSKSRL